MDIKSHWQVLKEAASHASKDKITKLSAALAYYTIFSLPALLLIVLATVNFFLDDKQADQQLFSQLEGLVGKDTSATLQESLKKTEVAGNTVLATIAGIAMLILGATGVFIEMQDSLNSIFGVKPNPKKGIWTMVFSRLAAFGLLLSLGFLLLVSLLASALLSLFTARLKMHFPDITVYLAMLIDLLFSLGVVTLLFAAIFKVLPDVRMKWKDVFRGALFTAVLFLIGKIAISLYLGQGSISSAYGAAGSIIILLLWVYYSSILLYFGAEYTRASAVKYGEGIHPNDFAEWVECSDDKVSGKTTH